MLRLVSYNIHKGIGSVDRRYDLKRIIDVLASYSPDVALLQEVDDGVARSRYERQVELLAEASGLVHFVSQNNVRVRNGHYGNAILCRYPLQHSEDVDLSVRLKKRRRAVVARCRVPVAEGTRTVELVNLHLGLAGFERVVHLRKLLSAESLRRIRHATPLIVAGDFNDAWGTLAKRIMIPAGFDLAGGRIRTFPAVAPLRSLDRVFYRGDLRSALAFAGHTTIARAASDHLPLIVDFELSAGNVESSAAELDD